MRRLALALAAASALAAAPGAAAGGRDAVDLLNLSLAPELASWLVGPHARLATKEEQREFLALADDAAARDFIERFWAKRDPDPERPGNPVRELAEQRAVEADRRFSEAGVAGRRTDRGTIFVLYGEPKESEHEPGDFKGEPPVEVWRYGRAAPAGLDGKSPDVRYRFVTVEGLTVFYRPGAYRQRGPRLKPYG